MQNLNLEISKNLSHNESMISRKLKKSIEDSYIQLQKEGF